MLTARPANTTPNPHEIRLTLPGNIELILCRIECPREGFRMGARGLYHDEEPVHTVVIPHAYYLGKYPVTQAQYRAVMSRVAVLRGRSDPSHDKGDHRPVDNVSWHEANRFCAALADLVPALALPAGYRLFCLPTEAEWEHACRAGTDTEYHAGDGEAALREAGWFVGNAGDTTHDVEDPMPNGLPPQPNGFGLRHMHGNVWEWCHDIWDAEAYRGRCDGDEDPGHEARWREWKAWHGTWARESVVAQTTDDDGKVTDDDRDRVLRGGSWVYSDWRCRSAYRSRWRPGDPNRYRGFRVCLVPGPAGKDAA